MNKTLNDLLIEYHKKFDDSEFNELKEKLMELASPRASFFQDLANDESLGEELQEKMEDYWRAMDELQYANIEEFGIFDDLRKDVKGLARCDACGKIRELKPKLLVSVLGTGNMYIGNLCESCYNSQHLCMNSKTKVTKDLQIPKGLTKEEIKIIQDFQQSEQPMVSK